MPVQRSTIVLATVIAVLLGGAGPAVAAPSGKGGSGVCRKNCPVVEPAPDTTVPSLTVSAPAASSTVAGTVAVSGSASDAGSGVVAVDVSVDGGGWQRATGTANWSWAWSTGATPNGSHTLTARATDGAGNVRTVNQPVTVANVVADTTAPSVFISAPTEGASVAGTVAVTGTAGDAGGLARVEVSVDGGAWFVATGTSSWSWSWPTAGVANGAHTLAVRATDVAGNSSTVARAVTVSNSTSAAPDTQGSWTSPEGVRINVDSAGPWTIRGIYSMLTVNALDLDRLGPALTVNVQDSVSSYCFTSVAFSNGVFSGWTATIWLMGVNSTFAVGPDNVMAHEYGHAWADYWQYAAQQGSWQAYQLQRWTSSDGSTTLATDSRTDTSYSWSTSEIVADDYRLLFGTPAAIAQRVHLNGAIPDPRTVPGLRDFLLGAWRGR